MNVIPLDGERVEVLEPRSARAFTVDMLDGIPVPARVWHVRGIVPGRTVTQLAGDGGIGKSTLALQLACSTGADFPWVGHEARQGRALFVSAEDDADELHRRLDAIALHHGVTLERFGGVKVWSLADDDALFATGAPGQALEPTDLWHDFRSLLADWRPRLIVLDSLADFYGGNENDRAQVRQFVRMLRGVAIESDAAVVLLSHPSLTGLSTGSGMSGSTAWNNSVRSRLYLSTPGEIGDAIRTLAVKKANYAAAGVELRLRYEAGVFVADDAAPISGLDKAVAADRVDAQFLEMLTSFAAQGRNVSHNTGRAYAPALFANDPGSRGTTSRGFEAAMGRLFAAGAIRVATKGAPSRQVHFIERVAR